MFETVVIFYDRCCCPQKWYWFRWGWFLVTWWKATFIRWAVASPPSFGHLCKGFRSLSGLIWLWRGLGNLTSSFVTWVMVMSRSSLCEWMSVAGSSGQLTLQSIGECEGFPVASLNENLAQCSLTTPNLDGHFNRLWMVLLLQNLTNGCWLRTVPWPSQYIPDIFISKLLHNIFQQYIQI